MRLMNEKEIQEIARGQHFMYQKYVNQRGFSLCMAELMHANPRLNCVIGLMTSAITAVIGRSPSYLTVQQHNQFK